MAQTRTALPLVSFALIAAPSSTLAEETPKPLTIVAFGDSTTAVRHTVKQVYADRLPPLLAACGSEAEVINTGIGGSHTGRLKDYFYTDAIMLSSPSIRLLTEGRCAPATGLE